MSQLCKHVACGLLLVGITAGWATAGEQTDRKTADRHYAAGRFDRALADFTALSAAAPDETFLRLRTLQCKLALDRATPAEEQELRGLRDQWAREITNRLSAVRDSSHKAAALARSGQVEKALEAVNAAEEELNTLAREVDVSVARRALADARQVVRTAPSDPAAQADRPLGDASVPGRGKYRLVKTGDDYQIVASTDVAPAPPAPLIVPQGELMPRPKPLAGGLDEKSVIWEQSDFTGLPDYVRADILQSQKMLRVAPKYYYERMLFFEMQRTAQAQFAQAASERVVRTLPPPHDYVVNLPRGVDYKAKVDMDLNLGADADGLETIVYDLSATLLPTDGPFDGLSYSRYLYSGYEGQFVNALTHPGVAYYYGPSYYGGGGGAGRGGPFGGGGGYLPATRSQILGGSPQDFAAGYPYVMNYLFGSQFGWNDPAQVNALIGTINLLTREPAARPAAAKPVPLPGN